MTKQIVNALNADTGTSLDDGDVEVQQDYLEQLGIEPEDIAALSATTVDTGATKSKSERGPKAGPAVVPDALPTQEVIAASIHHLKDKALGGKADRLA